MAGAGLSVPSEMKSGIRTMPLFMKPSTFWENLWGVDRRALTAFRIGLAVILLCDLFTRVWDLRAHYTDEGVLPRQALLALSSSPYHFSLHFLGGGVVFEAVVFGLAGVCAVALLVGYRPFLSALLSWILLSSLHARNPLLLNGGDTLLRLYLFWALFLPMGKAAQAIEIQPKRKNQPTQETAAVRAHSSPVDKQMFFSVGTMAILLQVAIVYACTAALKSHPWWTTDGVAIYYALNVDYLVTPIGNALLQFPTVLRVLTHAVYYLEWVGPFLVFIPWKTAHIRIAVVSCFVGLHVGFLLCMELGLFPWVSMLGWVLFLPSTFWDRLERLALGRKFTGILSESWSTVTEKHYRHPAVQIAAAAALVFVVIWNFRGLQTKPQERLTTRWFDVPGRVLWLDQKWAMFASRPPPESGWFVMPAKLRNNRSVDLFRPGKAVSWQKPKSVSGEYPNHRWRKLMANLASSRFEKHREYYAKYLLRAWNARHSAAYRVQSFSIYYVRDRTLPEGGKSEPKKTRLYNYGAPVPKKPAPAKGSKPDVAPPDPAPAEASATTTAVAVAAKVAEEPEP